ncbi:furin-like protease 1 isoform X3 [Musca domestica]|uniref:Furin-like protease 1 isoform X3 n=3 Tax=Musca domestica TaxID=7370 RepID=A0ABM3VI69_MUSDO|nr:furin-like protease 1 isoform X3 [Musca domestica]
MKNDVVRWSTQKRRKTYSKLCCNQENKKFPAYCAGEISYNTTFLGSSYASGSLIQSVRCDTLYNNIILAEDVNKYGSTNYPERRNWHNYLNEYRHESRRHSSNRKCRSSYWSTLIFEIGIAIFLCSFQVSLVSCSEFESGSVIDDRSLLHELDYADKESSFENHYTHTWAVHIPDGDMDSKADAVAHDNGFVNMGKIFQDHYLFAHHKVAKRSVEPSTNHQSRLDEDGRVTWSKQQIAKSRRKRDFIRMRPSRTSSRSASSRVKAMPFTDPKWEHMWYLNRGGDLDMNVIPAWKEGITGKGIVVTILDDGLESDHPDIINNYDPKASYDVNSHDEDPMPHYDLADSNRHGTRCAGEVAATANNSICAVGIAFGASVGGVRMLDGDVTDAVEARSLSLNPQHIDIYSASWGPDDDGKTVDGPGELASRAFIEGVTKGRAGKGSIFIWASGNGGREMDNCNCDGYTNSIWTLSISSATEDGFVPWYSEKCSSTLATTYSSGSQAEKQVVTTDLHHSCTVSHTGTSASAPLAAGIAALVLESNNNLTWRDMQHIVVRTAKPANLMDPTWSKNGVGRRVSHSFGYGLMDAAAMVKLARQWKTVPEQQRCEINAPHVDKVIPPKSHITLQLSVKNCLNINFLEHVQAKITLTSQRRGDIQINLISPAGTKVTLLTPRVHDTSHSGFNQWPFMSVHTWGESPHGNWQLEIHNEGRYMAQITQWDLIFYGTEEPAQPDDPVPMATDKFNLVTAEAERNNFDYGSNSQWRDTPKLGESGMENHDRTNTSCLKATINLQCLVCAPPTFFYRGRCYDMCPAHTYIARGQLHVDMTYNNLRGQAPDYEELQANDRKKRSRGAEVGETDDDGHTLNSQTAFICEPCDKSCFNCFGPLSSECKTCYSGSQLKRRLNTNESYCVNFSERSSGNAIASQRSDRDYRSLLFLVFLVPSVIIILVVLLNKSEIRFNICKCQRKAGIESSVDYRYDRVSLIADEEAQEELD